MPPSLGREQVKERKRQEQARIEEWRRTHPEEYAQQLQREREKKETADRKRREEAEREKERERKRRIERDKGGGID
eukprot:gene6292-1337_t